MPALVSTSWRKGVVSFQAWPWSPVIMRTLIGAVSAAPAGSARRRVAAPARRIRRDMECSFRQEDCAVWEYSPGHKGRSHPIPGGRLRLSAKPQAAGKGSRKLLDYAKYPVT